ncbi:hypothetical protein ACVQ8P_05545 [Dellaglioa sp. BT-FLS60]
MYGKLMTLRDVKQGELVPVLSIKKQIKISNFDDSSFSRTNNQSSSQVFGLEETFEIEWINKSLRGRHSMLYESMHVKATSQN